MPTTARAVRIGKDWRDHRNGWAGRAVRATAIRCLSRTSRFPAYHWDEPPGVTTTAMNVSIAALGVYTGATWGASGTTYPTGDPFRSDGASLWQPVVQVSGNHVHFTLWASGAALPNRMGERRVFADAVPTSVALALCGFAGLVTRRRRR